MNTFEKIALCREQILAVLGERICGVPVTKDRKPPGLASAIRLSGPLSFPLDSPNRHGNIVKNLFFARYDAGHPEYASAVKDEICERLLAGEIFFGDSAHYWLNNALGPRGFEDDPNTVCVEIVCSSFEFPSEESYFREQLVQAVDNDYSLDAKGVWVLGHRPEGTVLPSTSPVLHICELPMLNQDNVIPIHSIVEKMTATIPCGDPDHKHCQQKAEEVGELSYTAMQTIHSTASNHDWEWLGKDTCEVVADRIHLPTAPGFCKYHFFANRGSYRLDA